MLFKKEFKEAIRTGRITRTYRAWKRPQAKLGNRYNLAPDGVIEVHRIAQVLLRDITDTNARKAGFPNKEKLISYLKHPVDEPVYQVDFTYVGAGRVRSPVIDPASSEVAAELVIKLGNMDQRAESAWTETTLTLIKARPGKRAADLAPVLGWPTATFKSQVRKLKALGLTLSLETGYQLSPRGNQVLEEIAPAASNKQPAASNKQPAASNKQPAAPEKQPAATQKKVPRQSET